MIKWLLLFKLAASLNNFNWAKVTPYPSIAKEVAVYRFDIGLNVPILAGDTLVIKFPAEFPLPSSGPSICTIGEEPSIAISCSMSSFSLTYAFTALASADWPIVITVASITNPSSSITTSSFEFYQYRGSISIQQLLVGISAKIDPVIMPSASITTSSQIAAANCTWTLHFSIKNSVPAGGSIEVTTPSWNDGLGAPYIRYYCGSTLSCAGIKNVLGALGCSCNAGIITISLVSTLAAADTSISIGLLANPPNGKTVSGFLTKTKSGSYYLEQSPVISVTVSSPADITIASISAFKTQVSVETYYYFRVKCNAPVAQSYIMIITLSNEFSISPGFYITGLVGTSTVFSPSILSSTITLASIFSFYSNENFELSFYANRITNPFSTKPTSAVTVTVTTAQNVVVGYTSVGYSMTFTTNIFTDISVTALDSTIYATSTFTFTFTLSSKVVSDSYLQIKFPTEIFILARAAAACTQTLNGLLSTSSCAVSGGILTLTSCFSSSFTGLISFKIDKVTNPTSTAPTGVFELKAISGENYQILYDNSLSYTATPGVLGSSSFTPISMITGDITTYTFSITLSHLIPSGGVIYIETASQISFVSPACTPVSNLASSCSCVFSTTSITINNGFTSSLASGSLLFKISGVKNPGTTQTTDSFKFYTKYNNFVIDNLLTGLTTTMTTPNIFLLVSVSSSSNTIGDFADFSVSITPRNPMYSGGYVYILVPAQVIVPESPVCEAINNLISVSCSIESSGYLKAVSTFSSATVLTNFGFRIKSCRNPTTSKATDSFQISSFIGIYKIDQLLTGVSLTATSPGPIVISLNIIDVGISVETTYSFQLILKNSIPAGGTLEIDFPSSIGLSPTSSCSGISGCSMPSPTSLKFSYSSHTSTSITFSLNNVKNPSITSSVQISAKSSYQSYSIDSGQTIVSYTCHSPCLTCSTSADTCLTCIPSYPYIFQSRCYNACPSGSTSSSSSGSCQRCVSPCTECFASTTKCTSCITPLVQFNNECVSSCGTGMYSNNRICTSCGTNCDVCSSPISCSTCTNGFFLNSGNCVNNCPDRSFVQNSICISCSSTCKTCSGSMNSCLSCDSGFSLYNSNCLLVCPDNTASINQLCLNCSSSCSGCVGTVDNCTACANSYWLYKSSCVNACPEETIQIDGQCVNCNINCLKCTGNPNFCYQCKENLVLFNGECLQACPDHMTPLTFVCKNCSDSCSECSGSTTNCVACHNSLLLYKGQCINSCPGNSTIQVSGTCQDCSSPCSACSESATKCTSCIDSHYLYKSSCVLTCPDGYNMSSGSCIEIECALGCTSEKLNNSVCDIECNVEACNYDNYKCSNSSSDTFLARVPLPFTVSSVGTGAIVGVSKIFFPSTALTSATIALWGVVETGSWIGLLNAISYSETTKARRLLSSDSSIQLAFVLLLLCLLGHFILNITFSVVYFYHILQKDTVHKFWLSNKKIVKWFILPIVVFGSFKFIRMLDVSLFGFSCFQASYDKKSNLYKPLILFSYISIVLTTVPTLGCLIYVLVVYSNSTLAYTLALDSLIITILELLLTIYDIIILSMAVAYLSATVNASVSPQGETIKSEHFNIFTTKGDETDRAAGETDITGKIYPEPEDEYRDSEIRQSSRPLSKNHLIEEDLHEDNSQVKVVENIWNISFEGFAPKNLEPPPSILDIIAEESELDLSNAEIDEDRNHLVIVNHRPSGRRILVSKAFELDPDRTEINFDQYKLESVDKNNLHIGDLRHKNSGAKVQGRRNFNNSTVVDVEENGNWVIGKYVRREDEYDFAHAFQDPDDPESVVVWNKIGKVYCIVNKDFRGLPKLDFRSNLPIFHEKLIGSYDPKSIEIDSRNVHFANLIVENNKIRARRNFIGAKVIEVIDKEKYLDKKRKKAENIEEPELEVNSELEEPDIIMPTPETKIKKLPKRPKKPKPKGWENIEAIYLQRLEPSAKLRRSQISNSPSYISSPIDESYTTAVNVRPFASENDIEMLRRERSNNNK